LHIGNDSLIFAHSNHKNKQNQVSKNCISTSLNYWVHFKIKVFEEQSKVISKFGFCWTEQHGELFRVAELVVDVLTDICGVIIVLPIFEIVNFKAGQFRQSLFKIIIWPVWGMESPPQIKYPLVKG